MQTLEPIQFHVTNSKSGAPKDLVISVLPPVLRTDYSGGSPDCECALIFPVYMPSLGVDAVAQGAKTSKQRYICLCNGSVVEPEVPVHAGTEKVR